MSRSLMLCLFAAACASQEPPVTVEPLRVESVVPATIGLVVVQGSAGVLVAAVAADGPAAAAGIHVGDVLQRYNDVSLVDTRQFYRLMLDSPPGSTVRLELLRDGAVRRIEVPVEEIDTALRV
jgi:S1-C subfamily serine protease